MIRLYDARHKKTTHPNISKKPHLKFKSIDRKHIEGGEITKNQMAICSFIFQFNCIYNSFEVALGKLSLMHVVKCRVQSAHALNPFFPERGSFQGITVLLLIFWMQSSATEL